MEPCSRLGGRLQERTVGLSGGGDVAGPAVCDTNVTKTGRYDIYVSGVARIYRMLLSCPNH